MLGVARGELEVRRDVAHQRTPAWAQQAAASVETACPAKHRSQARQEGKQQELCAV